MNDNFNFQFWTKTERKKRKRKKLVMTVSVIAYQFVEFCKDSLKSFWFFIMTLSLQNSSRMQPQIMSTDTLTLSEMMVIG